MTIQFCTTSLPPVVTVIPAEASCPALAVEFGRLFQTLERNRVLNVPRTSLMTDGNSRITRWHQMMKKKRT
jgi:hypothetical protein